MESFGRPVQEGTGKNDSEHVGASSWSKRELYNPGFLDPLKCQTSENNAGTCMSDQLRSSC